MGPFSGPKIELQGWKTLIFGMFLVEIRGVGSVRTRMRRMTPDAPDASAILAKKYTLMGRIIRKFAQTKYTEKIEIRIT
jgi:hypothetical protein